ncbi:SdpI family protein [Clostridium sp.]|uniref:SdpI family protein n=1 Tax=Clostridium sp. TaxID=1506 RepID=UPI00261CC70F|nr:SdpI family protein [uncultured Clostridium sp.]
MSLIVGICFSIFGFSLMKYPPESINGVMGYKTPLSMKNQDTWDVSQKHSGFIMLIFGGVNAVFGIWALIRPIAINEDSMQLLLLLISVIAIFLIEEIHLLRIFHMDGSRRKDNLNQ